MDLRAVNLNILGTKAQSKVEMYRLLNVDWNLFLPPQREASIYFIRDILEQRKKVRNFNCHISLIGIIYWRC